MPDVDRHLEDPEALPAEVDAQRGLDAEPARQRNGGVEGNPGQATLAGQRLLRRPAGRLLDPVPRQPDDESVAAGLAAVGADLGRQRADRHVGAARPAPARSAARHRPRSRSGRRRGTADAAPGTVAPCHARGGAWSPSPRPCRGCARCRTTTAPARSAASAVPSVEPSSTTTTRSTPTILRTASTVAAIRSTSSLAGNHTGDPALPEGLDGRQISTGHTPQPRLFPSRSLPPPSPVSACEDYARPFRTDAVMRPWPAGVGVCGDGNCRTIRQDCDGTFPASTAGLP